MPRCVFDAYLATESFSWVKEYFRNLACAATGQVTEMGEKKTKEAHHAESTRLKEAMQLYLIASAEPGSNKPSDSWASRIALENTLTGGANRGPEKTHEAGQDVSCCPER